jgi:hypothetical protein
MKQTTRNLFGWYGVLAILLAYLLVSFNILGAKSIGYQLLNLTGAIGIVIVALSKKDAQPAVLNIAWAIIAIVAIARVAIH